MSVSTDYSDYYTSTAQKRKEQEKADVQSGKVSHSDFLKLLTTQLVNQDPLNPMQDIDFTAQLAQLQALDEQVAMTKSMTAMRLDTQLQAGSNMIGKYVSGVDKGGTAAAGLVSRVVQSDGEVYLELANKQQVKVTDVTDLWNDSNSMSQDIINSGNLIGMWVEAGYDSAMQPIQGIVEKVIISNGVVSMKLYGGKIVTWDQIQEVRAATEDELLYTVPDEVRQAYEEGLTMVGKVVTGKNDKGETVTGMVANAGINNAGSAAYVILYNGEQIKVQNIEGDPADPTVEDYADSLGGLFVKGLDTDANEVSGVVVGAKDYDGQIALVLADGKEVFWDALQEIRDATDEEKKAAEELIEAGKNDPGNEGGETEETETP